MLDVQLFNDQFHGFHVLYCWRGIAVDIAHRQRDDLLHEDGTMQKEQMLRRGAGSRLRGSKGINIMNHANKTKLFL